MKNKNYSLIFCLSLLVATLAIPAIASNSKLDQASVSGAAPSPS